MLRARASRREEPLDQRVADPAAADGIAVAPRGYLSVALTFEVANGKVTKIDVIADPERLGRLTLAVLDEPG
jgi:hypothetical protein